MFTRIRHPRIVYFSRTSCTQYYNAYNTKRVDLPQHARALNNPIFLPFSHHYILNVTRLHVELTARLLCCAVNPRTYVYTQYAWIMYKYVLDSCGVCEGKKKTRHDDDGCSSFFYTRIYLIFCHTIHAGRQQDK